MAIVRNVLLTLTILVLVGNSQGDHSFPWSFWRWIFRLFRPPVPGRCRTGNDCGRNQCCLAPGVCRPLGGVAANCDTRQRSSRRNPVAMVTRFNTCPCRSAYFCAAIRSGSRRGVCSFG